MGESKLTREEELALREYDFAEKLRSDYFKHSWVATSILLPVCFSLVALSYTVDLLSLKWFELLPLTFASFFLYIIWYWYDWRYSGYLKTIYRRLQKLEEDVLKFELHKRIKKEDPTGKNCNEWKKLGTLKCLIFFMLILIWLIRIHVSFVS